MTKKLQRTAAYDEAKAIGHEEGQKEGLQEEIKTIRRN